MSYLKKAFYGAVLVGTLFGQGCTTSEVRSSIETYEGGIREIRRYSSGNYWRLRPSEGIFRRYGPYEIPEGVIRLLELQSWDRDE